MSTSAWYFADDILVLQIRVQPRASRDEVTGVDAGHIKLRVSAPPVDDAANERLKDFLAKEFGVSRGRVRIVSGHTRREKRVAVEAPKRTPDWLQAGGLARPAGAET